MSDKKRLLKATLTGLLCGLLTNVILMGVLALVLTKTGLLPPDVLRYAMAGILGAGARAGGISAAKINRGAGLIAGVVTGGAILCVLVLTAALRGDADFTVLLPIKLTAALLGGALGGILGVKSRA